MTEAPWFYQLYVGQTHEEVFDKLGPRAFHMTGIQIVDKLIDLGFTPDVLDPSREPLPMPGASTIVRMNDDRTFMVSVDEVEGVIAVQELANYPYPSD